MVVLLLGLWLLLGCDNNVLRRPDVSSVISQYTLIAPHFSVPLVKRYLEVLSTLYLLSVENQRIKGGDLLWSLM